MSSAVVDNSISALSFDFLDIFECERNVAQKDNALGCQLGEQAAVPGGKKETIPEENTVLEEKTCAVGLISPSKVGKLTSVASTPRRYAWGLFYGVRMVLVAVLGMCVGSLVFTMVLNPGLTFEGAIELLCGRGAALVVQVKELLT